MSFYDPVHTLTHIVHYYCALYLSLVNTKLQQKLHKIALVLMVVNDHGRLVELNELFK